MQVADLRRIYDYGYWANARMFAAIAQLPPEDFTRSVAGSYGSIRNTLVHTLSAEWGWLDRCGGPPRGPRLDAGDFPTLESLVAAWDRVASHMREFLSELSDGDLSRDVEFSLPPFPPRAMPLGALLQHGANHAVHHRGQVALLIRMLGHAPGNFDLLVYDMEAGRTPATAH